MTAEQFCFWLQGHFELGGSELSAEQVRTIREHLNLVFRQPAAEEYGVVYPRDAGRLC